MAGILGRNLVLLWERWGSKRCRRHRYLPWRHRRLKWLLDRLLM